jgi:argininosuccinate lyase
MITRPNLQSHLRHRFKKSHKKLCVLLSIAGVQHMQRARQYKDVVMPAYTHYQPAVPVTYGHYLAGVAVSLERELDALLDIAFDLQSCPLGAGAVGGTSLPIRPDRTAELLGFNRSVLHSIEAVASRNFVLRLLASMVTWGTTLSRLANDFLLWTTSEFGFLTLPDTLVGSSSMTPQKRNPFLLEHVLGKSASALGAFTMAATAMHGKPFTNSIAVGTESVMFLGEALRNTTEATTLMRLVLMGAKPEQERLLQRAEAGYTTATELANRLMRREGLSFRSAHYQVGSWVRQAIEQGNLPFQTVIAQHSKGRSLEGTSQPPLDATSVVQLTNFGGGPGAQSLSTCLQQLRSHWRDQVQKKRALVQFWGQAEKRLQAAIQSCLDTAKSETE